MNADERGRKTVTEIVKRSEVAGALETARSHPEEPAARFLLLMARAAEILAEAGGEGP